LVALLLAGTAYKGDSAHANPVPGNGTVTYDVDPEITGNTNSTLGTVERCVRVDNAEVGFDGASDYTVDVIVTGDTETPDYYDVSLNYNSGLVHIATADTYIKLAGSFCLADALPDSDGTFTAGCSYLSGGPGTANDGTIVRIGLDLSNAVGTVTFSFNPYPQTDYHSSDLDDHRSRSTRACRRSTKTARCRRRT